MKKLLYGIFLVISVMIMSVSCGSSKVAADMYGVEISHVYTMSTDTFNVALMDSMSVTDNIPEYDKWSKTYLKDGSTGVAYEYATLYDPETGILYTVKKHRNPEFFVVMKRKTVAKPDKE